MEGTAQALDPVDPGVGAPIDGPQINQQQRTSNRDKIENLFVGVCARRVKNAADVPQLVIASATQDVVDGLE